MYTQYCKPAAVFLIKQRPLIRKLESYPLSVFYLRASIKQSFFLPACWAFLRTNKWLHHMPRLKKAWLKRSGFSTCLTKSHFDQEPLWLLAWLTMRMLTSSVQGSGLDSYLSKERLFDRKCAMESAPSKWNLRKTSFGLLSLAMKKKNCGTKQSNSAYAK